MWARVRGDALTDRPYRRRGRKNAADGGVDRTMQSRYVAYGLELLSSFPLPGMSAAAGPGLPQLALTRGSQL